MLRTAWTWIQVIAPGTRCTAFLKSGGTFTTPSVSSSTQLRTFAGLSRAVNQFTNCKEYESQPVNRLSAGAAGQTGLGSPVTSARSLTKFSLEKGKKRTVKGVIDRFMRLHWGVWIRPRVGRHSTLWRKSESNRRRLRQHVFCNGQQSHLFDKMVTRYWRRPRFYVDDPYEPYHTREEFDLTRKKPRPFP